MKRQRDDFSGYADSCIEDAIRSAIANRDLEELKRLGDTPIEHLTVESREATIGIIVQPLPSGGIRVVVQGFMRTKLIGQYVGLDGFYKYSDETVAQMPEEDFYEFD